MQTITLDGYADVREAFRQHDLEQALYDAGGVVMADSLLVLHGADHRRRRRVENRLFRRGTFRYWEKAFLRDVVRDTLAPFAAAGRADLVELGYRTIMNLTAMVAGLDQPTGSVAETDALYRFAKKFSEGATLVHSTRDPDDVRAEVQAALEEFDALFLQPSIERRRRLLEQLGAGEITEDDLPRDVLTALLRNWDELGIDRDVLRRECAFYLQAGSHSTADAFTHAADDFFAWTRRDPRPPRRPARAWPCCSAACTRRCGCTRRARSPSAARSGPDQTARRRRDPGGRVRRARPGRREPRSTVFDHPDVYDPLREVPAEVPRWGHAFGGGMHACIGTELAGGVPAPDDPTPDQAHEQVLGTVTLMLEALLTAGARPDPDAAPQRDPHSARDHFASYPVVFG